MNRIIVVPVVLLLAACSTTPKTDSSSALQPNETKDSSVAAQAAEKDVSISSAAAEKQKSSLLESELRELQKLSIYFDFDKEVVKSDYLNVIQKQAEFIKAHKVDQVTVEGNADERGSSEYNLGLGDRRANAVRRSLELFGVPATQIKTTSLGEEKPRLMCHEEKCWQENRRGDFVHKLN
ncbi:MAG: peptidoglycan-associated lipoprotein Pal [Gallionella sp.]|nr:peptidoglycan-associated lipoprotein Pal [Gallionella sp.]